MNGNARAIRVLLVTSRRRDGRRLCKDATEATPTPRVGREHAAAASIADPRSHISLPPVGRIDDGALVTLPDPMRVCSRCHEPKPVDAFRLDAKGYRRSHCNPCALAVTQEWRTAHRDALLARRRAAYATPHPPGATPREEPQSQRTAPTVCAHAAGFSECRGPTARSLGRREVP